VQFWSSKGNPISAVGFIGYDFFFLPVIDSPFVIKIKVNLLIYIVSP
jgi:hypothetical protein